MLSLHTTLAVGATIVLTWALAAFLTLFGLCNADPFGDYQGGLSEQLLELKMDGPQVPTLQMAPPIDIVDHSTQV
jgi:hypothetical protein